MRIGPLLGRALFGFGLCPARLVRGFSVTRMVGGPWRDSKENLGNYYKKVLKAPGGGVWDGVEWAGIVGICRLWLTPKPRGGLGLRDRGGRAVVWLIRAYRYRQVSFPFPGNCLACTGR